MGNYFLNFIMKKDINKEKFLSYFNNLDEKNFLIKDEKKRKKIFDFYQKNDFPNQKTENWKHTNISQIFKSSYNLNYDIKNIDFEKYLIPNLNANILVFVNGIFQKENSKIISKDLIIENLKEAKKKYLSIFDENFEKTEVSLENNFTALNTLFADDGIFIYVPKNKVIKENIHLIFISDGLKKKAFLSQIRNLIILDENSKAKIISSYTSSKLSKNFTNAVSEIILKSNSDLELNILEDEGNKSFLLNNNKVFQNKNSNFSCNTITINGNLIRNDLSVSFKEEFCKCSLNALYLADKKQHFDNFVFVNHENANCKSEQNYRGIIDEKAIIVFLGKIFVAKNSQQTDAKQLNKNVLLSDFAKVYSKPQLEIYADDVSCAHGSSTGQLDKEALFYLNSRGIGKKDARNFLLYAFILEILNKTSIPEFKNEINNLVEKRFKN